MVKHLQVNLLDVEVNHLQITPFGNHPHPVLASYQEHVILKLRGIAHYSSAFPQSFNAGAFVANLLQVEMMVNQFQADLLYVKVMVENLQVSLMKINVYYHDQAYLDMDHD